MNNVWIVQLRDESQPFIGPFNSFNRAFGWAIIHIPDALWDVKSLMRPETAVYNMRENAKTFPLERSPE